MRSMNSGPKIRTLGFGQGHAALDGGGVKAKIERHGDGTAAQDAEIDRQPLDAVGHQVNHAVALGDAAGDQGVGQLVGLGVKCPPGQGDASFAAGSRSIRAVSAAYMRALRARISVISMAEHLVRMESAWAWAGP
jgi:hypothetical protein